MCVCNRYWLRLRSLFDVYGDNVYVLQLNIYNIDSLADCYIFTVFIDAPQLTQKFVTDRTAIFVLRVTCRRIYVPLLNKNRPLSELFDQSLKLKGMGRGHTERTGEGRDKKNWKKTGYQGNVREGKERQGTE